jgi:hypothetical protein
MATNAQQVGIVSSTKGQVFARNAEGEMRRVQAGDPIFEGDVIIAAAGASAEISLLNGSPSLFVSDQQIVAIDEQVATTAPDATAGAVANRLDRGSKGRTDRGGCQRPRRAAR